MPTAKVDSIKELPWREVIASGAAFEVRLLQGIKNGQNSCQKILKEKARGGCDERRGSPTFCTRPTACMIT